MKRPTIKVSLYALVAILFLTLVACKNGPPTPPTPPVVETPSVPPTPPEPPTPSTLPPPPTPPTTPTTPTSNPVSSTEETDVPPTVIEKIFQGQATYYADHYHGKKTKTEEIYDKEKYTCAIRQNAIPLPMGSVVEVYSVKRKKKVEVRVNDIMSNKAKAVIDLSRKAAEEIGLLTDGRTKVTIRVISESE